MSITFFMLFLFGCYPSDKRENITYYKVEHFYICNDIDAYVNTSYTRLPYEGKLHTYDMVLVNEQQDTIYKSFATREDLRFYPGDTIYQWYGRWLLK